MTNAKSYEEHNAAFARGEENIFGQPTDVKAYTIAQADAYTNNAGLPTYSELIRQIAALTDTLDILNLNDGMDNAVGAQIINARRMIKMASN